MTSKIFAGLVFVAVLYLAKGKDFHPEAPCSSAGGHCLLKSDCSNSIPEEYLNLCPKQRQQGVECCHGLSLSETRCQKLGGECFKKGYCKNELEVKNAKNCGPDQVCCVVI